MKINSCSKLILKLIKILKKNSMLCDESIIMKWRIVVLKKIKMKIKIQIIVIKKKREKLL